MVWAPRPTIQLFAARRVVLVVVLSGRGSRLALLAARRRIVLVVVLAGCGRRRRRLLVGNADFTLQGLAGLAFDRADTGGMLVQFRDQILGHDDIVGRLAHD